MHLQSVLEVHLAGENCGPETKGTLVLTARPTSDPGSVF